MTFETSDDVQSLTHNAGKTTERPLAEETVEPVQNNIDQ